MQRGTLEGKTWDRGGWDAGDTGEAREVEVGVRAAGRVRSWLAELTSCGPFEGRTRARSAGPHSEGLVMGEEGRSPASLSAASPPARPHPLPPTPPLVLEAPPARARHLERAPDPRCSRHFDCPHEVGQRAGGGRVGPAGRAAIGANPQCLTGAAPGAELRFVWTLLLPTRVT